jgi:hypothetical protein
MSGLINNISRQIPRKRQMVGILNKEISTFDVHESVHRDTTMKITNKMHYID